MNRAEIIAKGKLEKVLGYYWLTDNDKTDKIDWLIEDYVGQHITICLEGPEEENVKGQDNPNL